MRLLIVALFIFIISFQGLSKEVPDYSAPIVDEANVLDDQEESVINGALKNLNYESGIQFQVYAFSNLDDETIESYSIKVADKWKIGNAKTDKGALLLIALNDRKMRIEVGQGLEGDLTDAKSKQIIREISKFFKEKRFGEGIITGLALMAQVSGAELKLDKAYKPRHHKKPSSPQFIFFIILGFIFFVQVVFGRSRRSGFHHGSYHDGFGGGGFSGGGGNSGGWSGGGGGFSGGGASGDW